MLKSLMPISVILDHERQLEGRTYLLSFCGSVINYTFLLQTCLSFSNLSVVGRFYYVYAVP